MKTVVVSLFAGMGGFDLAAEKLGWESGVICEIKPSCKVVLKHYWPAAYHHEDIKTLTGEKILQEIEKRYGPRDSVRVILVGGPPCQPFSLAGARKGGDDDRNLWNEALRIAGEFRFDGILFENVPGLTSILSPASDAEMESQALLSVGSRNPKAIHEFKKRDKVSIEFQVIQERIMAEVIDGFEEAGYSLPKTQDQNPIILCIPASGVGAPHRRERIWFIAHAHGESGEPSSKRKGRKQRQIGAEIRSNASSISEERPTPNAQSEQGQQGQQGQPEFGEARKSGQGKSGGINSKVSRLRYAPNTQRLRQSRSRRPQRQINTAPNGNWETSWINPDGRWPTEWPVLLRDDGVSRKLGERSLPGTTKKLTETSLNSMTLTMAGNAVVPYLVFQILKIADESGIWDVTL